MNRANGQTAVAGSREEVRRLIAERERFLLVTHENPDGDALGSLVGMQGLLTALGKDSLMFVSVDEFPLPYEYRFFELDGMVASAPADLAERAVIFLDCGNIDRNPAAVVRDARPLVNIDHHHDNTLFGSINHVVADASCTAEIVWDLMQGLDVRPTPGVAVALYVGLVTDTGRFSYENTTPRAHAMAAELIEAGVDVQAVYRRLYEDMPFAKLRLLSRALEHAERYDGGRLIVTHLAVGDYEEADAETALSEGVIDYLRAVRGTRLAAFVRELSGPDRRAAHKVSLRSSEDAIDVSAIARAQGGGGHPRAAGFSTELELPEIVAFLREALAGQLADGRPVHTAA